MRECLNECIDVVVNLRACKTLQLGMFENVERP